MKRKVSTFQRIRQGAEAFWEEREPGKSRLQKFFHFWLMVWKSFTRNRCPVRAAALAYTTLLALIPMLAVAVSITSTFLKKEGEAQIDRFIVRFVANVTPPGVLSSTNAPERAAAVDAGDEVTGNAITNANGTVEAMNFSDARARTNSPGSLAEHPQAVHARHLVARQIHQFIQNTRSGALGVTGSVLLIFAAISMLSRIESTFNDIWGVARGRNWFFRIVLYWGVLTLVPLLVAVALGLSSGPHLEGPKRLLGEMPYIGALVFKLLPIVLLCLVFSLFYMLMPNTHVNWLAALGGGSVAGLLLHLNNLVSVLYVSRVVSNSKIYGSLGLVPVFMIGLYFFWWILLFGAQVAYAFQNRASYLESRQIEQINQRGREFVALRLVTSVAQRFLNGEPPPGSTELSAELNVPTRLIHQIMETLGRARLIVETSGSNCGFVPARPLQNITCHDVLTALRAGNGNELATRDESAKAEVFGEYSRIQEAERKAAASVTLLALASRAQAQDLRALPASE